MAADEPAFPEAPPPAAARPFDPRFLAAATATFLLLLALAEGASRWAVESGLWYRKLDFGGTLTSLPELENRIRWFSRAGVSLLLLGDSVLGPTALLERGSRDAWRESLSADLRRAESARGRRAESLAADGMLVPDLEGVERRLGPGAPARVLLMLNFRMFADEYQAPDKAVSRDFLRPGLPEPLAPAAAPPRILEDRLDDWALAHSMLFRATSQLKTLWYYPSRRDFYRRWTERLLGPDADPEIQEAALRLKVAGFYATRWNESSTAFRSLDRLLGALAARGSSRVAIVLAPQNPDFVEDTATFRANRDLLARFLEARKSPTLAYYDWADRYASGRFVDHCHLTADGNRELAKDLSGVLAP